MSSTRNIPQTEDLQQLRVDILGNKSRRHSHKPTVLVETSRGAKVSSRSTDFVYVNSGYVASVHDVRSSEQSENRVTVIPIQPPTSVIREQYWTCSKWSTGQRFLVVAVAVLFGTVVGLAVTVILKNADDNISNFFMFSSTPN